MLDSANIYEEIDAKKRCSEPVVAVRGRREIVDDSLDGWLESRFRILFGYGRGGACEPGPPHLDSVGENFLNDIELATTPIEHSHAACYRNRQDLFALHDAFGKATLWLTISPPSTSIKVLEYATGSTYTVKMPSLESRQEIVGDHPVAAALFFEKKIEDVLKYVVGYDTVNGKPYARGGLFGHAIAWQYSVEEQVRLTLHCHMLIWLAGHSDLDKQLEECVKEDEQLKQKNCEPCEVNNFTNKLQAYVKSIIDGELVLPEEEMIIVLECRMCKGRLNIVNNATLREMRFKSPKNASEPALLKCVL